MERTYGSEKRAHLPLKQRTMVWPRPWCWERLKAGGEEGIRGLRWLDNTTNSVDMNMSKLQKTVKDRGAWHAAVHGVAKSWSWLNNWTATTTVKFGELRTGATWMSKTHLILTYLHGTYIVLVQLLSCIWFIATPRTAAQQVSLSSPSPGACSNSCPLSC